MCKSVIEDFFDHVLQWQTVQGPEGVFKFKGIKASDGRVSPACYAANTPPSQHNSKQTSQRKANFMPNAISNTCTKPNAAANSEANASADAEMLHNLPPQSRGRKVAKGTMKQKQPCQRSMGVPCFLTTHGYN